MLLPDVSVQIHHELLNMLGHRIPIAARRSICTHTACRIRLSQSLQAGLCEGCYEVKVSDDIDLSDSYTVQHSAKLRPAPRQNSVLVFMPLNELESQGDIRQLNEKGDKTWLASHEMAPPPWSLEIYIQILGQF